MASTSDIITLLEPNMADVEIVSRRAPKPLAIVPHDPAWAAHFASIAALIRGALGAAALSIEHVGSTSVPGLAAKDVIDVDMAVADPTAEAAYVPALEAVGFRFLLREPRWYEHRLFGLEERGSKNEKNGDGNEEGGNYHYANLHVFGPGSPELVRHRLFRDWLRRSPEDRDRYAAVKREAAEAAAAAGENVQQYNARKQDVLREILQRAFEAHGLLDASSSSSSVSSTT